VIEVNLLPGGRKRGWGGSPFAVVVGALKGLTSRGGGGAGSPVDRYSSFFAVAAAITIGYMGWSFWNVQTETESLSVQLEKAVADSSRNAVIIQNIRRLEARGDSIQERVAIIQEIDAGRYVWPHLLDEVAAAVPDYLWLREVLYQSDSPLMVRVTGRAGSLFAITRYMRRLEASRFLRGVSPETMQQVSSEANPEDLVYMFELIMTYEPPSLDELETVPLFDDGASQALTAERGN